MKAGSRSLKLLKCNRASLRTNCSIWKKDKEKEKWWYIVKKAERRGIKAQESLKFLAECEKKFTSKAEQHKRRIIWKDLYVDYKYKKIDVKNRCKVHLQGKAFKITIWSKGYQFTSKAVPIRIITEACIWLWIFIK